MNSSDDPLRHTFLRESSHERVRPVDFASFRHRPASSPRIPPLDSEPGAGLGDQPSFVSVEDHEQQAQERLWKARLEAARKEGFAEATARYEERLQGFQERFDSQQHRTLERLLALERAALDRVLEVAGLLGKKYARHLLDREVTSEDALVAAVRAPLLRACGLDHLRLFVHPDAVAPLESRLKDLLDIDRDPTSLEILPDPHLALGDCRITSEAGQVESLLDERLDRLVDLTASRLEAHSHLQPPLLDELLGPDAEEETLP